MSLGVAFDRLQQRHNDAPLHDANRMFVTVATPIKLHGDPPPKPIDGTYLGHRTGAPAHSSSSSTGWPARHRSTESRKPWISPSITAWKFPIWYFVRASFTR